MNPGQNEIAFDEVSDREEDNSVGATTGPSAEEELHREDRHRLANTRDQTHEHQHRDFAMRFMPNN